MENAPNVDYAAVLADLKKRRADLDLAISVLEGLAQGGSFNLLQTLATGQESPPVVNPVVAPNGLKGPENELDLPSDAFFGMSIVEAGKKYLNLKKRPASTQELADVLTKGGYPSQSAKLANTVHAVLTRNSGGPNPAFAKVKRGTWGLRAWYPNYRPKDDKDD